jgi:hypothetical protein
MSAIWLAGSLAAVLLWCFSDFGRLGFAFAQAVIGCRPIVLVWSIVPALAIVGGLRAVMTGHVWQAASCSAVPILGLLIYYHGGFVGETLRFQINKAAYQRVVSDADAGKCSAKDRARWHVDIDAIDCEAPIAIIFVWGGFGPFWHGIVYDAADEMARSAPARSGTWKQRPVGGMLSCTDARRSLGGHYYLAGGVYHSGPGDCR